MAKVNLMAPTSGYVDMSFNQGITKDVAVLSRHLVIQSWTKATVTALAMEDFEAPLYVQSTHPEREYMKDSSGATVVVPVW